MTQSIVNRDDFLNLQLELHEAKKQLQQYKSIVKAVDPDNLPKFDVLALNKDGEILEGRIYTNHVNGVADGLMCESDMYSHLEEKTDCTGAYQEGVEAVIYNVTHYIETKDIIKMMGDL